MKNLFDPEIVNAAAQKNIATLELSIILAVVGIVVLYGVTIATSSMIDGDLVLPHEES